MTKNCFNFNFDKAPSKQKSNPSQLIKAITTTTKIPIIALKTTTTLTTISFKQKFRNEKIFKPSTKIIKANYLSSEKEQIITVAKQKKEDFLISKIKSLCNNYFKDESIFKKQINFEYFYTAVFTKSSEYDLNDLPVLCSEFKSLINKSHDFNDRIETIFKNNNNNNNKNNNNNNNKNNNHNNNNNNNHRNYFNNRKTNIDYFNYYYNSVERLTSPTTESSFLLSTTSFLNSSKFKYKKCYEYRNTDFYKQCMNIHYKCYQYNNDLENLKNCRKNNGITVTTRKSYNFY